MTDEETDIDDPTTLITRTLSWRNKKLNRPLTIAKTQVRGCAKKAAQDRLSINSKKT